MPRLSREKKTETTLPGPGWNTAEKMIPGQADVVQAHRYLTGIGAYQSYELAVRLYRKAAHLGNTEALYYLAYLHKAGKGVKQDLNMFVKLLKEAGSKPNINQEFQVAVFGVGEAKHGLGVACEDGVVPDWDEAARWYKSGSDLGCSAASYNLAFLYMNGTGVGQHFETGIHYWKVAASQGSSSAMRSLAWYYLTIGLDFELAKNWNDLAIANGNLDAIVGEVGFSVKVHELESGMTTNGEQPTTVQIQVQLDNLMRRISPDVTQITTAIECLEHLDETQTQLQSKPEFDVCALKICAAQGSTTAQQILEANDRLERAMKMFYMDHKNALLFLHELAECFRINYQEVVEFSDELELMVVGYVVEVLKKIPQDEHSELDKDARVCYASLSFSTSKEETLAFLEESKRKYPEELMFHSLITELYVQLDKHELAIEAANTSLKTFPASCEILYHRATAMKLAGQHAIEACKAFLKVATIDPTRPDIAEVYFMVASEYYLQYEANLRKKGLTVNAEQRRKNPPPRVREYYKLGLKAEVTQLACYKPPRSELKTSLQAVLGLEDFNELVMERLSLLDQFKFNEKCLLLDTTVLMEKLNAGARVSIILAHRQLRQAQQQQQMNSAASRPKRGKLQLQLVNRQQPHRKLVGFQEITLAEMDVSAPDKIYENRVIQLTSVEEPVFDTGYMVLVLEDGGKHVCRADFQIYQGADLQYLQQQLGCGSDMSILNPHMKRGSDGKLGLRLADWGFLFPHHPFVPDACRFCGRLDAALKCGKCGQVSYCNRVCQKADWKTLKHSVDCAYLRQD